MRLGALTCPTVIPEEPAQAEAAVDQPIGACVGLTRAKVFAGVWLARILPGIAHTNPG